MAPHDPTTQRRKLIVVLTLVAFAAACERPTQTDDATQLTATNVAPTPPAQGHAKTMESEDSVGKTTRAEILERFASWSMDTAPQPAPDASKALATVPPGATIDVYLGTWCGDSRREVRRFWRALDIAGDVPFEVDYIGVSRDFTAGDVPLEGKEIVAVPTFVVLRDGEEVGRLVERSPVGVEVHLVELLSGAKTGKISATR